MKFEDKTELARLLAIYQNEQIERQKENEANISKGIKNGKQRWEVDVKFGTKAKYEHARILHGSICKEINDELKSYWQL